MAFAEQGRQTGWEHDAASLVTPEGVPGTPDTTAKSDTAAGKSDTAAAKSGTAAAKSGTTLKTAVDRNATPLDRRKSLRLVGDESADTLAQAIETSLAHELDLARADIAGRGQQSGPGAAASPPPSITAAAPAPEPAASISVDVDAAANAKALAEKADRFARENALLSRQLAEADLALRDARLRIKSLEKRRAPAAEAQAAEPTENQQNELRASRDRLQEKCEAAIAEHAGLSRTVTEKDRALFDARVRHEYLEAALAAAEAECGRAQNEAAGEREKHQDETATLKARVDDASSRATTAEELLAESREHLRAQTTEIDALRQRVAQAEAVNGEVQIRQRQLEDALSSQQSQCESLQRSQAMLAEATKHLLQRLRDRDRALVVAEDRNRMLAERNARLEAVDHWPGGPVEPAKPNASQPIAGAEETARQDWIELARLLSDFLERKISRRRAAHGPLQA
jgi:hypothetical protein